MSRIKTVKKGEIQLDKFSTKRSIDVDVKDFNEFFDSCGTRSPLSKNNVKKAPKIVTNEDGTISFDDESDDESDDEKVDMEQPIEGDGFLVLPPGAIFPKFLTDIVNQVEIVHKIKKEDYDGFAIMTWVPIKNSKKVNTIPRAPIGVTSRVILICGSKENFSIEANAGGITGSSNLFCLSGDSFSVPIGVSAALDIKFDDTNNAKLPAKNGFRPTNFKKNSFTR